MGRPVLGTVCQPVPVHTAAPVLVLYIDTRTGTFLKYGVLIDPIFNITVPTKMLAGTNFGQPYAQGTKLPVLKLVQ